MIINMNREAFENAMKEKNKPVLVDFWAPWCVYCRRIGPAFDKLGEELSDQLVFGKINIDEENALAVQEQIEVIPTLVLYQNGQAIGSIVAPESKAKIEAFIRESLNQEVK
ncbi:MAG: thioredoxin [Lachnospiraceae bacterium]|nr:thioredoxin [Lachnospiraceae bacterium]